jgi:hypothetical protein
MPLLRITGGLIYAFIQLSTFNISSKILYVKELAEWLKW